MVNKQPTSQAFRKAFQVLLILVFFLGLTPNGSSVETVQAEKVTMGTAGLRQYLPVVRTGGAVTGLPLMTGISPTGWPGTTTANNEMKPLDTYLTGVTGGRATSIWGTFMPLNLSADGVKWNVEVPLTEVWNAGYTPFINLPAVGTDSAYTVATSAQYDAWITAWAQSFKNYANGGARFAYIAPLQEMNGYWVPYGRDPDNFIRAYRRFQTIFANVGVPAASVKWVFAPNAWTKAGEPLFERYYPGNSYVDVVAISAYNYGYCKPGGVWQEPVTVFNDPTFDDGHYLDRMRALAPSKPIFIAQTGTSSWRTSGGSNAAEKERWLRDAYKYLSTQANVRAVIYFNIWNDYEANCDWKIFSGSSGNPGYKTGATTNGYQYISPSTLKSTDHVFR